METSDSQIRSGHLIKCHRGVSKLYNKKHPQFLVLTRSSLRWSTDEAAETAGQHRGTLAQSTLRVAYCVMKRVPDHVLLLNACCWC
jgi:hypothetical protein